MFDENLRPVVEKAKILTEALPYIRDFHNKTIVIKLGSSVLRSEETLENTMNDISLLKLIGMKVVVVHSGSDEISRWVKRLGKDIEYLDGNRVTDKETMEIVEMVLGKINKDLVRRLEEKSIHCVGICGKDSETVIVDKKVVSSGDVGYFGEIRTINTELISKLLEDGFLPIIASIGIDEDYESYNLNADDLATAIAKEICAEKLVFLAKEPGICEDDPENTVKSFLDTGNANILLNDDKVDRNVRSKLICAVDAACGGVNRVHIISGACIHGMLLEFFTDKGIGTAIYESKGENTNGQN